ncbi:eclosion hormone-like [Portunus trituberculatus]|uniref:Eclosion hormone n=1 Tax=Portunus trituberculatus TaxID=210409 RepID=A0A5B7F1M3_PORTR|nr:eclosion hormone-like [Portunus trituberculatus]XP_045136622.1 eclosion hormone-like [Portunus trituberculatus]XP_045136623.1 eclosion hormone-like [Portunus trituberculatus]MPC41260.1 Eclosion hormone [Portunus trituberculatus]
MVGSRKVVVSALLVLSVALVLAVLLLPPSASAAVAANRKVSICIKNCGQCKKMYTDYFNGGLCGDFCLQTEGRFIPDCNRPDILIPFFLQRLE